MRIQRYETVETSRKTYRVRVLGNACYRAIQQWVPLTRRYRTFALTSRNLLLFTTNNIAFFAKLMWLERPLPPSTFILFKIIDQPMFLLRGILPFRVIRQQAESSF